MKSLLLFCLFTLLSPSCFAQKTGNDSLKVFIKKIKQQKYFVQAGISVFEGVRPPDNVSAFIQAGTTY